ncbi:MAG TPA: VCBS repeat-containing protein, partial [Planctomycetota bacterium]|nr:VCBS repeat-containing protein [Planctomycetota bacterium]
LCALLFCPISLGQISYQGLPSITVPLPGYQALFPGAIAVGTDVNGDGFTDVVTGKDTLCTVPGCGIWLPEQPGGVQLLLGQAGGLLPPSTVAPSVFSNRSVTTSDLDLDGDQDLVILGFQAGLGGVGATIQVLHNDGLGNFVLAATLPTPVWAANLAVGDVNGDLTPDVVILGGIGSSYFAQTLINLGGGSFTPQPVRNVLTPLGPARVADINGDGCDDVMFACVGGLGLLAGSASGHFLPETFIPLFAQGSSPADFRVLDYDNDGNPDLVTIHSLLSASQLLLHRGDGIGGFALVATLSASAWYSVHALATGDIDLDGDEDVVVAWSDSLGQNRVSIVELVHQVPVLRDMGIPVDAGPDPLILRNGPRQANIATFNHFSDTWSRLVSTSPQIFAQQPAQVGMALTLQIEATLDVGLSYFGALAFAKSPGISLVDGRLIDLTIDPLFLAIANGTLVIPGLSGTLVGGVSSAIVPVPPAPILSGTSFFAAFVTLDPAASLGIRSISATREIRIQ